MGKYQWEWTAKGKSWLIKTQKPCPSPPEPLEPDADVVLLDHFINDGNIEAAIGKFVTECINGGYTVAVSNYTPEAYNEKIKEWQDQYYWYQVFQAKTKLTVDFECDKEIMASPIAPLIIAAIAVAIAAIGIGIGAGAFFALQNLTTTKKTIRKFDEEGNLISEEIIEEPPLGTLVSIIIIAVVLMVLIFGISSFRIGKK